MKFGLNFPDIYKKYITIDTSDLRSLYKNLGVPNSEMMPEKLKSIDSKDVFNSVTVGKEDFYALVEKYGKIYSDSISNNNITIEKGSSFEADGEQIKCNKFTLKFDEKWFKDFILKVYDAASDDDVLFDKFYSSFVNVMKVFENSGSFAGTNIELDKILTFDKAKFKENFKNSRNDFKTELDKVKLPDGITMILWANDKKEILGRKLEFTIGDDSDLAGIILNTKSYMRGKDNTKVHSAELEMSSKNDTKDKVNIKFLWENNKDGNNIKDKFNIGLSSITNNRNSDMSLNVDSNSTVDESTSDTPNQNIKFDLIASSGQVEYKISGEADITKTSDDKEKTTSAGYAIKLNFDIPGYDTPFTLNINLKNENKMGVDFTVPEITSSNSTSLNTSTSDELDNAMQEMMLAIQNILQQNNKLSEFLAPGGQ